MLGMLASGVTTVLTYYFGSSSSGRAKDAVIGRIAEHEVAGGDRRAERRGAFERHDGGVLRDPAVRFVRMLPQIGPHANGCANANKSEQVVETIKPIRA